MNFTSPFMRCDFCMRIKPFDDSTLSVDKQGLLKSEIIHLIVCLCTFLVNMTFLFYEIS